MNNTNNYETDFFLWSTTQADLLRNCKFEKLDISNLVEEIESLGRSEKRALQSYLEVLLMHLLKYNFQKEKRTRSWELSIKNSRLRFKKLLCDNPSLKNKFNEILLDAYECARTEAALETGLDEDTFPDECIFSLDDINNENFFEIKR